MIFNVPFGKVKWVYISHNWMSVNIYTELHLNSPKPHSQNLQNSTNSIAVLRCLAKLWIGLAFYNLIYATWIARERETQTPVLSSFFSWPIIRIPQPKCVIFFHYIHLVHAMQSSLVFFFLLVHTQCIGFSQILNFYKVREKKYFFGWN